MRCLKFHELLFVCLDDEPLPLKKVRVNKNRQTV